MPEYTTGLPIRATTNQAIDDIVKRIEQPTIPDRQLVIDASELLGSDAQKSLQKAIDELAEKGGGRIELFNPAGSESGIEILTLELKGPIHLRSRIELRLGRNLILKFCFDPSAYAGPSRQGTLLRYEGTFVKAFCPLIRALGCHDVILAASGGTGARPTICGEGERWQAWAMAGQNEQIDTVGQATYQRVKDLNNESAPLRDRVFAGESDSYLRPTLINLLACQRVRIEGVRLMDAPFWVVHPVFSTDLIFRDIEFDSFNLNNDGIDPDSCCRVLIEGIAFGNGDDNIAIKSGRDREAREGFDATGTELEGISSPFNRNGRWTGPTSEVVIRRCGLRGHHAICVGSEVSGGAHDIFAVDNRSIGDVKLGFFIKSSRLRGGNVHRIICEAMQIDHARRGGICINTNYDADMNANFPPTIKDIELVQIHINRTQDAVVIHGWPDAKISSVQLSDIHIAQANEALPNLHNAEAINFERVFIAGKEISSESIPHLKSSTIPAVV
jgi:polygalacturonase